jgi:hypothetical protein
VRSEPLKDLSAVCVQVSPGDIGQDFHRFPRPGLLDGEHAGDIQPNQCSPFGEGPQVRVGIPQDDFDPLLSLHDLNQVKQARLYPTETRIELLDRLELTQSHVGIVGR